VLFLLHPTYVERTQLVRAQNGVAKTNILAEGRYNVVTIAVRGRTVVRYDLTGLDGAPKWFLES